MTRESILVTVVKRDRLVVAASLAGITALAWAYLARLALGMDTGADGMADAAGGMLSGLLPWTAADFALMALMWAVMMTGMMIPAAAPMILLFATISRKKREQHRPWAPTAVFAMGYVLVWSAFAVAATVLQGLLQSLALLSPMMVSTSPVLGGVLFIAAGLYQWTPLKRACLRNCRSPLDFVAGHWREGARGALRMGAEHGVYCLGCCWVLMGLLFAVGVMNLVWVAALAAFVAVEKIAPGGEWVARASGAAAVATGLALLLVA